MNEAKIHSNTLTLRRADITCIPADCLVTAANASLCGGGGVDGAIHRAAGPELLAQCRALGGCPTGEAVITDAGNLPARHVIHAVGPIHGECAGQEAELLAGAYRCSLQLALDAGAASVAFPAISCGVYGYPLTEAADVALGTTCEFLGEHPEAGMTVTFALFEEAVLTEFTHALARLVSAR